MTLDDKAAAYLFPSQRGVLGRLQTAELGVTPDGLRHRIRPGGSWQRMLPGVYLTVTGEPTRKQLEVAALLYAGAPSIITGPAALRFHDIRGPRAAVVDVLVPASRRPSSCAFVRVHRTRRMPEFWMSDLAIRYALPARAVADAVRSLDRLADARTVVASAVQQRRCTIDQLASELRGGHDAGTALLRQVLSEVRDGIRSAPEGDLRALIIKAGLPVPLYNPDLYLDGEFLARPDAWWPEAGVAVEVDSMQFHLLPEDFQRTMRRRRRMAAAGIIVLAVSPHQLRTEPDQVLRDIAAALKAGQRAARITTRPAAA